MANSQSPVDNDTRREPALIVHDQQAQLFRERYEGISAGSRYESTFHYGRARLQEVLDRWIPAPGKGRRLLDVGCGTGHHISQWTRAGYVCVGVEPAPEMMRQARLLNPGVPIEKGSAYALPFPDASFDLVVALEVLRYLADVRRAVQEARRVLKPGGEFIATAMSPFSLCGYPLVNAITGRFPVPGFVHLRQHFHSRRRITRILREEGFKVEDVVGVPFVTAAQKVCERLFPSLFRWSLHVLEPLDRALSNVSGVADLALHLVFRARVKD